MVWDAEGEASYAPECHRSPQLLRRLCQTSRAQHPARPGASAVWLDPRSMCRSTGIIRWHVSTGDTAGRVSQDRALSPRKGPLDPPKYRGSSRVHRHSGRGALGLQMSPYSSGKCTAPPGPLAALESPGPSSVTPAPGLPSGRPCINITRGEDGALRLADKGTDAGI